MYRYKFNKHFFKYKKYFFNENYDNYSDIKKYIDYIMHKLKLKMVRNDQPIFPSKNKNEKLINELKYEKITVK